MAVIRERARAKINLTLRVLGRRADGYHALESLIVFADVSDDVSLTPGAPPVVQMDGPYASAIAGSNLIDTALERLAAADPALTLGRIEVDKRLPIAAGIGGGSADAAAVLRAARSINPESRVDWHAVATSLGADVPVCLSDRSAFVWGFGEQVEPVATLPHLHAVLVCPHGAAPFGKTRSVFSHLSVPAVGTSTAPAPLPAFADAAALIAYMRAIGNDLQAPAHAVMPSTAAAEAALAALPNCLYVSVSGAGPTSYGIFADAADTAAAAAALTARHPAWWITPTILGDY